CGKGAYARYRREDRGLQGSELSARLRLFSFLRFVFVEAFIETLSCAFLVEAPALHELSHGKEPERAEGTKRVERLALRRPRHHGRLQDSLRHEAYESAECCHFDARYREISHDKVAFILRAHAMAFAERTQGTGSLFREPALYFAAYHANRLFFGKA